MLNVIMMKYNFHLSVCKSEQESTEETFSHIAASAATFVLTLLLTLPLGILLGCCASQHKRCATKDSIRNFQHQGVVDATYESPGPVKTEISLSENIAYGQV